MEKVLDRRRPVCGIADPDFCRHWFFSGDRIEWARQAADRLVLLLAVFAVLSLALTWYGSSWLKKFASTNKELDSLNK